MLRILLLLLLGSVLPGAEHRGTVLFNGLPVPGATVTATRGHERVSAITDEEGGYKLDLADGPWSVEVGHALFRTARQDVTIASGAAKTEWSLEPKPVAASPSPTASGGFTQAAVVATPAPAPAPSAQEPPPDVTQRAADGLLINGSVNNSASSVFALLPAFGNHRRNPNALYNGSLGFQLNNSAFDARPYSLTGQDTARPSYNRMTGLVAFGGPIRIPHWIERNGPNLTLNYQWTHNTDATVRTGLMPTAAERAGDLSALPGTALDATTGAPLAGNVIPASRLSPQAQALLALFPKPNFSASTRYNYQVPLASHLHQDDLQSRVSKPVRRNFYSGRFAFESARSDTPDLFSFLDTSRTSAFNLAATLRHTFSPHAFVSGTVEWSRQSIRQTPYFAGRRDIAGAAGIGGVSPDPADWGPPNLTFSAGLAPLTLQQSSLDRNQSVAYQFDGFLNRGRHYIQYGAAHRRQQFNALGQQDARGSFTFTGAAAGTDLAGFLEGVADTGSIAYGNADKYLRANTAEGYLNDDWRIHPGFTVNAGLRWDSWSPATEKYGRLVTLRVGSGFSSATPVVAAESAAAAAAGEDFPQRDWRRISPRAAFSWRPLSASSLILRGGYGIYNDTSVYQPIAMRMAQQAPLSKNLRLAGPLALDSAFLQSATGALPTFAVDANFHAGYAHNWQLSMQRDLPGALQAVAWYEGSRGTHGQQTLLPNTYPVGGVNPCAACPSGFTFLTSGGNSVRHAGRFQLRRRLRSGVAASLEYTLARSIDNGSSGGRNPAVPPFVAQNWQDLRGERARSSFDQHQLLSATAQYTTGMGLHGGALAAGRRAALLKEWTLGMELTAGSGLPLTPVYAAAVPGAAVAGVLRPNYTGAALNAAPTGLYLNPAALAAPAAGQWGNAGRNSIDGPRQFAVNASLGRTFRSGERLSLDFRLDARNALNSVTYPSWNTTLGSAQFGLPSSANPMRVVQSTIRARF